MKRSKQARERERDRHDHGAAINGIGNLLQQENGTKHDWAAMGFGKSLFARLMRPHGDDSNWNVSDFVCVWEMEFLILERSQKNGWQVLLYKWFGLWLEEGVAERQERDRGRRGPEGGWEIERGEALILCVARADCHVPIWHLTGEKCHVTTFLHRFNGIWRQVSQLRGFHNTGYLSLLRALVKNSQFWLLVSFSLRGTA